MCDAKSPTLSLVMPLRNILLQAMEADDMDILFVRDIKTAVREDMQVQYTSVCRDFLLKSTTVDPRFHTLPFVSEEKR